MGYFAAIVISSTEMQYRLCEQNDPHSEVLLDLSKGRIAPIESLDGEENVEKNTVQKYGIGS